MSTIWQTYRGGPSRSKPNAITVSISKNCVINLSRAAAWLIGNPDWVLLHYDERNSVIGLTAATAEEPGAIHLRPRSGGCGRSVSITPFCRHFRIQLDGTEQFDDPKVGENGILNLDLKHTHRVAQLNPRPKGGAGKETRGTGDVQYLVQSGQDG